MSDLSKPVSSGEVLSALAGTALDPASTGGAAIDWTEILSFPKPTSNDKALFVGVATVGDNAATGLTITGNPVGHVSVSVNGIGYLLGDADKTKDCYFSADGGTTAKAISAIVAGDQLIWNGLVAGLDLSTTHRVAFDYMA